MILNEDDIKQIKHAFIEMDSNHDGLITIEDLQVAKKKLYVDGTNWKELLIKLDLDGNGKIDFEEFLVAATDH